MGIANSRGVLPGTRGRAGAQRLVWTPVRAHGAAARVAHLSASTWPAQHPAAAPHTPSSSRRGRAPPTRATRESARRMDRARPRARARSTRRAVGPARRVRLRARRARAAASFAPHQNLPRHQKNHPKFPPPLPPPQWTSSAASTRGRPEESLSPSASRKALCTTAWPAHLRVGGSPTPGVSG